MIVVVPPHAAARVPVSKVSAENVPPNGISMCVCTSIPPGSTYLPVASMTWSAAGAASPVGVTSRAKAAAVELPQVPDLGQLVHVQVAHQHLVLVVRGGVAHQLPARIGEVRLAVEVVVAERLDADPVDRADEVLVGHRGGGLLQPPQVLRQAAAGGRWVEHDPGPGQAER